VENRNKYLIIGIVLVIVLAITGYWLYNENQKYEKNKYIKCTNCGSVNVEIISRGNIEIENLTNGTRSAYVTFECKCLNCDNFYTTKGAPSYFGSNMTDQDIYNAMGVLF